MDRSLKKLSRVELLELMVNLSEDYERLSIENERLKEAVQSRRLPRSAKVGSIAEAALKANGYFEAAQRSADEYLREIKGMRDELAARTNRARSTEASQQAESQAILNEAQAQAQQILERAQTQAERILADARARSEQAVANANRQSHAIMSQVGQGAPSAQNSQGAPVLTRSAVPVVESRQYGQQQAGSMGAAASLQTGDIPRINQSPVQTEAFQSIPQVQPQPRMQPQPQVQQQPRMQPQAQMQQQPHMQMQAQMQQQPRMQTQAQPQSQQRPQVQPQYQTPATREQTPATQVPASRQGYPVDPRFSRPYTGAPSYGASRPYMNTAPAYAGGTATHADTPDVTSELPIRGEGMRYVTGRSNR